MFLTLRSLFSLAIALLHLFPTVSKFILISHLQSSTPISHPMEIENIVNYTPKYYHGLPKSVWSRLPCTRRSAVFILLFLGKMGELRVILTKRSSQLRNFPGHISLPGGKADSETETEWQVSRREMEEEIGISADNEKLKKNFGFSIDHLKVLPCYLSRTFLAVRPCVGFMRFGNDVLESELIHNLTLTLNPGESSGIFSCPLRDFLHPTVDEEPSESIERQSHSVHWGSIPWNLRSYIFPQRKLNEPTWLRDIQDLLEEDYSEEDEIAKREQTPPTSGSSEKTLKKQKLSLWGRLGSRRDSETQERIYDVWGLTANILHDLAKITYGHAGGIQGEEELIYSVWHHGNQMRQKERSPEEAKLINATISDNYGFLDILPRLEFLRLKNLYRGGDVKM